MSPGTATTVRDVLHVATHPCSGAACNAIQAALQQCDRDHWYPSLLMAHCEPGRPSECLAQSARVLGVPVMVPRQPRGRRWGDWGRSLLDQWFYVRNAHPVIMHVHVAATPSARDVIHWIYRAMPQVAIVESIHAGSKAGSMSATTIRRAPIGPLGDDCLRYVSSLPDSMRHAR